MRQARPLCRNAEYGLMHLHVVLFRDLAVTVLKTIPDCEPHLVQLCARFQGNVTEINELHDKVSSLLCRVSVGKLYHFAVFSFAVPLLFCFEFGCAVNWSSDGSFITSHHDCQPSLAISSPTSPNWMTVWSKRKNYVDKGNSSTQLAFTCSPPPLSSHWMLG